MICNMLTTGAMARLGYVYGNLMVNLHLKNEKLLERGIAIVQHVTKADRALALKTLEMADMKVSAALVMLRAGVTRQEAVRRLRKVHGNIRQAIEI
jgi:N-acetylmuramic acid 6-phosphate etherase